MATRVDISEKTRSHLARWYGDNLPGQVTVLRGSLIGTLFGLSGQAAVTINKTIHMTPKASDLDTDRGWEEQVDKLSFKDDTPPKVFGKIAPAPATTA